MHPCDVVIEDEGQLGDFEGGNLEVVLREPILDPAPDNISGFRVLLERRRLSRNRSGPAARDGSGPASCSDGCGELRPGPRTRVGRCVYFSGSRTAAPDRPDLRPHTNYSVAQV